MTHPDGVPIQSVPSIIVGLLFGQLQNSLGNFEGLPSDVERPVDVVFQYNSKSPPVLDDELSTWMRASHAIAALRASTEPKSPRHLTSEEDHTGCLSIKHRYCLLQAPQ